MKKTIVIALLLLSACAREGIQTQPEFTDGSYRTRDREHNRYEGYAAHHERAEQWQTDPYWTSGEGLARRKAMRGEAADAPAKHTMPMPPARFMKR